MGFGTNIHHQVETLEKENVSTVRCPHGDTGQEIDTKTYILDQNFVKSSKIVIVAKFPTQA